MASTQIKEQGLASTTRLASKVITATRDLSAAGAPTDVAYTGVGFIPTSIQASFGIGGSEIGSSFVDSSKTSRNVSTYNGVSRFDTEFIFYAPAVANYQGAIVKSFDADGFTLTWTKTGSPTGSLFIAFLCFR